MINQEIIVQELSEKVVPVHNVPEDLFAHQIDTMALIKDRKHVFLGIKFNIKNNSRNQN